MKLLPFFEQYSWPGNIRELQNIIQRLSFFIDSFDQYTIGEYINIVAPNILAEVDVRVDSNNLMRTQIKGVEQELILKAVAEHKPLDRAAEHLGIGRSTLVRKLKQIRAKPFTPAD